MDPHKRSVTIEVMADDERVLASDRFGTDRVVSIQLCCGA